MNNKSQSVQTIALVSLLQLAIPAASQAAADPVIAPPGGTPPAQYVRESRRILKEGDIQHLVCFKFIAPTAQAPLTLQNLQMLGADGKPVLGKNGRPQVVDSSGQAVDGTDENSSTTLTNLPEVVSFVKQAYFTEARKVSYLSRFGGGENMSHEGTSTAQPNGFGLGYDLCFSAVFHSVNDRDYFVGDDAHPEKTDQHHHAFRNLVGPAISGDATATPPFAGSLLVFDYL